MYVTEGQKKAPSSIKGKMIGGVLLEGEAELKVMASGKQLQLVELKLKKGYYHPPHNHPEHESIGYVISGELEMMIGEETYILGPGDGWIHPIGVIHSTRALEDTYALESHSPLRPEFLEPTN